MTLSAKQREALLRTLQGRFEKNMRRHEGLTWERVQTRLEANADVLRSLNEMEATGGEPDVIGYDKKTGQLLFAIVQRRARRRAEIFVTTGKGRRRERRKACTRRAM